MMRNIFCIKKEERWLVLIMLIIFVSFNALLIYSNYSWYTKGVHGGFWTIFSKHFQMSGYDNWSWITISSMRVHFDTMRHPLYLTFLYPMYLLNHWLINTFGYNFAVYFMSTLVVIASCYAVVFMYRILREVLELKRFDSTLLTVFFFSFAHVLIPTMVPDHFVFSLMLLLMTLYIVGRKMKKNKVFGKWQTAIILFFTSGMALSNGAKIILAGLFTNKKKFFSFKYILIGIAFPLALLFGIQRYQYYSFEVPQKEVIHKIEETNKKKNPEKEAKHQKERTEWIESHLGKAPGDGLITQLLNFNTSRTQTLVENFFGESLQIHQDYALYDLSWNRPVFVTYSSWFNYFVEIVIVLLFITGVIKGIRSRYMLMLLTWFACDVFINIVLGFGICEVYIMTAGWAFIIPISIGYLLKDYTSRKITLALRTIVLTLGAFLFIYNGSIIVNYLLNTPVAYH